MEAFSPISEPFKKRCPRRGNGGSPLRNAPSVVLPLSFIVTGLTSLLVGVGWLVARPSLLAEYHYNQYVVAATHLFVLGWICTVIMGTVYQIIPVALETKLYSERLVRWQLAFHVVGFTGMVWMFRVWNMKQVGHFGCILAVGLGLFVYNVARTLRRVPKWNVTATAVASALGWLCLAGVAGLSIAAGKCTYETTQGLATTAGVRTLVSGLRSVGAFMSQFDAIGAMHAHAHLGGIGCFVMLIVGVSYKLVPMFTLSEVQSRPRALWSVWLLNIGLVGLLPGILWRSPWKLAGALVVIAGLALYGWELRAMLRARKRPALDWGIKSFLTSVGLLVPLAGLALVLTWPGLPANVFTAQLENVYGFLGLLGVVSFATVGMLYKIIPFLVWFGRYSPHLGRARVPSLADLYSARLQVLGYWSYLSGLVGTSLAIALSSAGGVRWGCALLAFSVVTLVLNVGRMFAHFFKPRLKPLTVPSSPIQQAA